MRCEGTCNRSFRRHERVYAVVTRVIVVRDQREQVTDVEAYYCERCFGVGGRPSLYATGVARVG